MYFRKIAGRVTDQFLRRVSLLSMGRVGNTVEFRLYIQVGTQKGRRTERDVNVKIIFHLTPCKVLWTRDDTNGTYKRMGLTTE